MRALIKKFIYPSMYNVKKKIIMEKYFELNNQPVIMTCGFLQIRFHQTGGGV